MNRSFAVIHLQTGSRTQGLAETTGYELELQVGAPQLLQACANLAGFLGDYFSDPEVRLRPGDRVDWASALLVSRQVDEHTYTFDELSYDGETVREGVQETVRVWAAQSLVCDEYESPFSACRYGALIAVSPGLLNTVGTVIGTRYPAPSHMSGWWLFTEDYDGTVDGFREMKPTHAFHVLSKRPEIAPLLGLAAGFEFHVVPSRIEDDGRIEISYEVQFDQEIAEQGLP